ncbi:hypothetical protein [Lacimicrobium alkaliphilum]|nr:hypothetical protein [Lacimicrobium alkaliphilum]
MHQSNAPEVRVEIRPRLRLDKELRGWLNGQCPKHKSECDSNWMLFGVIPEWGWKAPAEQTFNWVPLFRDADILVSSHQKPIRDFTPASLTGLVFAGLHGHQYPGILGQLIQTNKLTRDNGSSNLTVLQRVAKGRADITLIRRSTLNYLIRNERNGLTEQLYLPDSPYNRFTLQVMLPANRPDLRQWLITVLNSAAWRAKLKSYGIPPLDTHGSE